MADSVGYCAVIVTDTQLELTFPVAVLYPTRTPGQLVPVGLYQLDVAPDAPIIDKPYPLVLISHGTGSSGLVHRNLAHYLARHGYVVGLLEHPHNNRDDNSWANTLQNLVARPRHLQLAIDQLTHDPRFAPALQPGKVALIGHSLGAYTALALLGGQPVAGPHGTPDGQRHPIPTPPADERVKAVVLLAPAVPWFEAAGSLQQVHLPMLLLVGEQDEHTPPAHAQLVLRGVPDAEQVTWRVIHNAGHFSFLSPFPPARVSPAFPPSQDPPGFDRGRFHEELYPEVLAFLSRFLSSNPN
ncbi:alpha/beta hydrolase family protein [Hymenobacter wooponensis]|uniref:Alpha/beta hydrolase n=1 Tax=Hymenobacter wooponensis TaxID=1525360 RepID=A0A4Z0MJQ5_9BACT|nr:alpha/beta hydrolase [Hymenobacter wooponensis]TGD79751.1 alpha/beta hydrolase [Hymenobacter wooponensis]